MTEYPEAALVDSDTARCRSCNGVIVWARGSRGGLMPVDVEPNADGNVLLHGPRDSEGRPRAMVLAKDDRLKEPRAPRLSHFVSCPSADLHRR